MTSGVTNFLPAPAGPGTRHPQRPPGAQARGQLAAQRAAALHVERLVDRLVARSAWTHHRGSRPAAGSRSAPGSTPSPTAGPARRGLPRPFHAGTVRARHRGPVRVRDLAGEPVLHVLAQPVVRRELGDLRAARRAARRATAPSTPDSPARPPRVAALRRSSREIVDGVAADPAGDLAHAHAPGPAAARSPRARQTTGTGPTARQDDRRHPATFPEPPRHRPAGDTPDRRGRVLAGQPPWRSAARTPARPRAEAPACPATASPAHRPVSAHCLRPAVGPAIEAHLHDRGVATTS